MKGEFQKNYENKIKVEFEVFYGYTLLVKTSNVVIAFNKFYEQIEKEYISSTHRIGFSRYEYPVYLKILNTYMDSSPSNTISFVKYTGYFNGGKVLFYEGSERIHLIGSPMVFFSHIGQVPNKEIAFLDERLHDRIAHDIEAHILGNQSQYIFTHTHQPMQYVSPHSAQDTNYINSNNYTNISQCNRQQVKQQNTKSNVKRVVKTKESEEKNDEPRLDSVLTSTLKMLEKLDTNKTTSRLDRFHEQDKEDLERKLEEEAERKLNKHEDDAYLSDKDDIMNHMMMGNNNSDDSDDSDEESGKKKLSATARIVRDRQKKNKQNQQSSSLNTDDEIDSDDSDFIDKINELKKPMPKDSLEENDDDINDYEGLEEENKKLVAEISSYFKSTQEKIDMEQEEIDKDMDRVVDLHCELRDIENRKRREAEREEENKRKFSSDKRTYVKIKNDVRNPRKKFISENNIPVLFEAKYHIFKYMEENELIDFTHAFDDSVELDNVEYIIYKVLTHTITKLNKSIKAGDESSDSESDSDDDNIIPEEYGEDVSDDMKNIAVNFTEYMLEKYQNNGVIMTENEVMIAINNEDGNEIFEEDETYGVSDDEGGKNEGSAFNTGRSV